MSGLSADQLRAMFAKGILKHGKGRGGKRGKVIYDRKRDKEIKKMQGKGNAGSTYRQKGSAHIGPNSSKNFAQRANSRNHFSNAAKSSPSLSKSGAGLKAAHLRGGGGGEKPDHSATRAARLEKGRKALLGWAARQAGDYRAKVPTPKKGTRKEMPSQFGGKFLDSGKSFQRGEKIFYGDGKHGKGAYSNQEAARKPRLGRLDVKPRKGVTSSQLAATAVVRDAVGGDRGQRESYRTLAGFRRRFQKELAVQQPGRQFGKALAAPPPAPRFSRPKVGERSIAEANRVRQGIANRGAGGVHDASLSRLSARALNHRVEVLRRNGINVAPEMLHGNARQFSQRVKAEKARREAIGKKHGGQWRGMEAYGQKAGHRKTGVRGGRLVDVGR